jgi:hypothetical protein
VLGRAELDEAAHDGVTLGPEEDVREAQADHGRDDRGDPGGDLWNEQQQRGQGDGEDADSDEGVEDPLARRFHAS